MSARIKKVANLPGLPARPVDGHKGTFGRVLVVGGSEGMIGAPVLAGTAALRMGSGLVQLAVPREILAAALSITPELIGLPLGNSAELDRLDQAARVADAVVLGPGLGTSRLAAARVAKLLKLDRAMVLDADALNILAMGKRWPASFKAPAVLTPHPGEMNRLAKHFGGGQTPRDESGRVEIALAAARAFGQIIILKGHRSVVTDGRRVHINTTGDSTLAKAGSGDVLSGMVGSLLGQGMGGFEAACLAVYLHGLAGELAGKRLGQRCALARDLIDALPDAIRRRESADR